MSIRSMQRKHAAKLAKEARPPVVKGNKAGFRRHRREKGGGNAVRKTMRVFRAAYRDQIDEMGFNPARYERAATAPLDISGSAGEKPAST